MSDNKDRVITLSAVLHDQIAGESDDRKEELILGFLRECANIAKYVPSSEDYEYLVAFFESWESYYKASFGQSPKIELKLYTESERKQFRAERQEKASDAVFIAHKPCYELWTQVEKLAREAAFVPAFTLYGVMKEKQDSIKYHYTGIKEAGKLIIFVGRAKECRPGHGWVEPPELGHWLGRLSQFEERTESRWLCPFIDYSSRNVRLSPEVIPRESLESIPWEPIDRVEE